MQVVSLDEGRKRRDKALARVASRCGEDAEVARVWACALAVARRNAVFTSECVAREAAGVDFVEPRRLGPLMRDLFFCGIAEPTADYVQASRASRHVGTVRKWRSLVYRGGMAVDAGAAEEIRRATTRADDRDQPSAPDGFVNQSGAE